MEFIERITINNIRRFSDNVEIEVGRGATIFYAPNGTGKTSIFEAIELALTGAVKRLGADLTPLIRDNCNSASVKLTFNSGKYCEVQLAKGNDPVVTGNHDELFGTVPPANLPYLLRLTHLLNQRADGWFVQSQSNIAGAQLDYLSIGREATQANKVIISAKRAATGLQEKKQRDFEDAKTNLNVWLELIRQRDSQINIDPTRPLVSIYDLHKIINEISKELRGVDLQFNDNLQVIISQRSEVLSYVNNDIEIARGEAIELDQLLPFIEEYNRSNIEFKELSIVRIEHNNLIKSIENKIYDLTESLNIQLVSHNVLENDLLKFNKEREFLLSAFKYKSDLNDINLEIESVEQIASNHVDLLYVAKENYKETLSTLEAHRSLFNRSVALAEERTRLTAQKESIDKWYEHTQNIKSLALNVLPEALLSVEQDDKLLKELQNQVPTLEASLIEAQRMFDIINSASDAIRKAVAVIALELPDNRSDCPVCNQTYTPLELKSRISKALNSIAPELEPATLKLEEAKNKLDRLIKRIGQINLKQRNSSDFYRNVLSTINLFQRNADQILDTVFPDLDSIEHAESQFKRADLSNKEHLINLEEERRKLPLEPSADQVAIVKNRLDFLDSSVQRLNERLRLLNEELQQIISSDELDDVTWEEFESNQQNIDKSLSAIRISGSLITSIRKSLEDASQLLSDELKSSSITELKLLNINSDISVYKAKWASLQLVGEPSTKHLNEVKDALNQKLKKLEEYIVNLDSVNGEIARLNVAYAYFDTEEKIIQQKGRLSELNYTAELTAIMNKCNKELIDVTVKAQTLNSFALQLSRELENVHELIRSVNPLWNKLLKRIVIDPRFSETILNSYSFYKKQHADVNIHLHGGEIRASHVASEAQITDLQLTFLLALAQSYEWTPWKALLLDDPTQHHDLVHASAVFDLLRDYIAEQNFQVMLATHDSVQARFFMRKLENDGIPARICDLHATSQGVRPNY